MNVFGIRSKHVTSWLASRYVYVFHSGEIGQSNTWSFTTKFPSIDAAQDFIDENLQLLSEIFGTTEFEIVAPFWERRSAE